MASKSWFKIENKAADEATVTVYDEISSWGITAKEFVSELKDITAKTINLRINSPGGNVFDGITIHNALKEHSAQVKVHVDGLAASIASIIAMAGDEIRMAKNSFLMIHNAWAFTAGNAAELRKLAGTLDKVDATLVQTYQDRTGASKADIKQMMADETWLNADEALAAGFCDAVGDKVEAQARFDLSKFNKVPHAVAAMNIKPENERDLEAVLRDSGLSKKDALTAVAGLKAEALRDSEQADVQKMKDYMQAEQAKGLIKSLMQ
jgi:ATP-dependent protease ClpP protease subunit